MAILEISNLNVTIATDSGQPIKLIENFSITLHEGQVISLIGETGSGKSIIARIIAGFIKPDWQIECQSFRFNGQELLKSRHELDTTPLSQQIGIIQQDPAMVLDPTIKIGKQLINMMLIHNKDSWLAGFTKCKQYYNDIRNILTRLGVKESEVILDSYLSELSATEAQIVAIAMTLVTDPLIILADEPTTGMNSVSSQKLMALFKRLNANYKKSMIFLSNNLLHAKGFVDQIQILYFGQVVERFYDVAEITNDLINYSHHPYTRLFLHSLTDFADTQLIHKSQVYSIPGELPELASIPPGCRFGPRCDFSQSKCMKFPSFTKDRDNGHCEFACHFGIDYLNANQLAYTKEIRDKIRREIETKQLEDKVASN